MVLCLGPIDKMTIICMGGRKFAAAKETLIPEVSSEDHAGDFLRMAGSHAQRICTLNSTEVFFFNRHYNPLLGFGLGRVLQSAVASGMSNPQLGGPVIRAFQLSPQGAPSV